MNFKSKKMKLVKEVQTKQQKSIKIILIKLSTMNFLHIYGMTILLFAKLSKKQ
jgi:hypothetical protein